MYDITNRDSFENLPKWMANIKEFSNEKVVHKILIANKCDLEEKRVVTKEEG